LICADLLSCSADPYTSNTSSKTLTRTSWGGDHCKVSPILTEGTMKTTVEAVTNKIITLLMLTRENLGPMLWSGLKTAC
jgi:hypothetical protein